MGTCQPKLLMRLRLLLMMSRQRCPAGCSAAGAGISAKHRTMTTTESMEGLKFYGDLLSASCRTVAIFMKINDIPYTDMQATAIRRGRFATPCRIVIIAYT